MQAAAESDLYTDVDASNYLKLRRSWQKVQVPVARKKPAPGVQSCGGTTPGQLSPAALSLGGGGIDSHTRGLRRPRPC